jgi:hypothetical protein
MKNKKCIQGAVMVILLLTASTVGAWEFPTYTADEIIEMFGAPDIPNKDHFCIYQNGDPDCFGLDDPFFQGTGAPQYIKDIEEIKERLKIIEPCQCNCPEPEVEQKKIHVIVTYKYPWGDEYIIIYCSHPSRVSDAIVGAKSPWNKSKNMVIDDIDFLESEGCMDKPMFSEGVYMNYIYSELEDAKTNSDE